MILPGLVTLLSAIGAGFSKLSESTTCAKDAKSDDCYHDIFYKNVCFVVSAAFLALTATIGLPALKKSK